MTIIKNKGDFYFNDKYGTFTPVKNFVCYWAKENDIRVGTQSKKDGSPLALTVEIANPGTLKLDKDTFSKQGEHKLSAKVNYSKIPRDNLPRLVQSLVNIFNFYKDREDKKTVYFGINGSYPYTISEEEYNSIDYKF